MFWESWELWQKLCFILATGIVIVITLGVFKLTYNSWRLRKYAKIKADTLALKRETSHSASVKRGRAKEIPFGIRALEKGVEIEGIWNSRANTPAPSLPGSPIISPASPRPKHQHDSSISTSSTMTRIEISSPSDLLSPASANAPKSRSRPSYKPRRSSGLRYSNASADLEQGHVLPHQETNSNTSSAPSQSSNSSPSDSPTNDSQPQPVYHLPPASIHSHDSHESNPFLTPTASRKESLDEPVPLSHIDPLISLDGQPHQQTIYHPQFVHATDIPYDTQHAQPIRSFDVDRGKRTSQVVRKINSGFEILRPGTFDAARGSVELGPEWKEVREEKKPKKLVKKGKRDSLLSVT